MSRYTDLPTLEVDFLKPGRFSFDVQGGAIDSGRNGLGESISIEMTGGGMIVGSYENCYIHFPEEHEYANYLAARMNGSFRFMNVPILTDWVGPFPRTNGIPQPIITGIPFSDGAHFSDGAGFSQATVFAVFQQAAAVNAGEVTIAVIGAQRNLRWSDWMSTYHATKGWRMWRYWKASDPTTVSVTVDGITYADAQQYTLSITPPLREAVSAGQRVELARPLCTMKFPSAFTLPWEVEGFWRSSPTIKFTEAF